MILIIDQNKEYLAFYKYFYKKLDINSIGFTNAAEAYDHFINTNNNFKIITTELSSGCKNDGLWLAQNINLISELPIILITAVPLVDENELYLFSAILPKPFKARSLIALLNVYYNIY